MSHNTVWRPMDSAPTNRRILVKDASGKVYSASWSKNFKNNRVDWMIARIGEDCILVLDPVLWTEIPA